MTTCKHNPVGRSAIRGQLTRMVLIPSVSFLLLWALLTAAGTTGALRLTSSVQQGKAGLAALDLIAAELRTERELTQVFLGAGSAAAQDALLDGRERTDATFARERERVEALLDSDDTGLTERARAFFDAWGGLPDLRKKVDNGETDREAALQDYTALLSAVLLVNDAVVARLHGDSRPDGFTVLELMRAQDRYTQADALLSGAMAAGAMGYSETAHFTYLTASYRDILNRTGPDLSEPARAEHQALNQSPSWIRLQDLSLRVLSRPPVIDASGEAEFNSEIPVDAEEWDRAMGDTEPVVQRLVAAQTETALDAAWSSAVRAIAFNVVGSLIILLAGIAAIVYALRSARRLTGRLHRLHTETLEVADSRLPELVARAGTGLRVDVTAELPTLRHGQDELGRVADAFNTAQRTAAAAAVRQAEIREGANRAFLGIAYRNQTLIQRQLRLLDEIESAEDNPDSLRRLLRLDHLVTRGRRYADNLLILAGAATARRWKDPMPLLDVLRAATSEIEDYERVRLRSAARAGVRGHAVADLTHLIAELVENAVHFSPDPAQVDVHSRRVRAGAVVEVTDRGLGMSAEQYAEANGRLAEPPEFDVMTLSDEPRLGLFVVARLAARHGVTVRLEPSPYGGALARVVLPHSLLTEGASGAEEDTGTRPAEQETAAVRNGATS
ncbi:sensor histidine kinase [Thermobifida halotolerans]|uniref:histidine kinase n=1 Tax=Thermobifida halotolerans TaxID=483545 RepID=A0A399G5D5_9ACTN|nr:nitrate- and nitrite sensing domain-containing protein [Thermobifida halotolerans]UOE17743.1 sensor histidine kinase [Thermobifida halotolerans]